MSSASSDPFAETFTGRVVVISPHLDDAVMSLGATMAQWAQRGAKVEVLTVFAYVPGSEARAGPWDTRCGYRTEGQAADSRREEDRNACLILGVEPRWLTYGAEPYERRATPEEIWAAVAAATAGADCILLPGYPVSHPDHAELSELLIRKGLACAWLGLYAEQPYQFWQRKTPLVSVTAAALQHLIDHPLSWERVAAGPEHRRTKLQAVRAYGSQLRHLGLGFFGLRRMIGHEGGQGGERIAWLRHGLQNGV